MLWAIEEPHIRNHCTTVYKNTLIDSKMLLMLSNHSQEPAYIIWGLLLVQENIVIVPLKVFFIFCIIKVILLYVFFCERLDLCVPFITNCYELLKRGILHFSVGAKLLPLALPPLWITWGLKHLPEPIVVSWSLAVCFSGSLISPEEEANEHLGP